ncbi:MAG: response regulator [Candidatus Electrothrix sp. AX2]|nr:response regulator [Candidatus Electrothrix gigas]
MTHNEQPHILIADDEIEWRKRFTSILKREGYKISCATSHEEVVRIINESNIDLICLDVLFDGEYLREGWIFDWTYLLTELQEKNIPVIVITGIDSRIDSDFLLKKSEEYSVSSILFKRTLDRNKFIAKVKKIISFSDKK